ncbi:MAG: thioredoxin domain-containing protein [Gammaproteobacteria bacterium]|jgi:protein-disulfide isomerase|nr:thioredoxin domain-containing protein [Gammaproteobacteria bacterium]
MNKRDQQRQRREQKQRDAQKSEGTRKLLSRFGLYFVVPVLALIVVYTLMNQAPTYSPIEVADNDHVRGDRDAPVTIVVYADFQCPACATEHDTMMRLWPEINDDAHLIFRHFPITTTHPNSWTASLYAEAAGRQGRFWEMHDALFQTQQIWSPLRSVEAEFDSYALELNIDIDRLHADMQDESLIEKIRADQRGGNTAGVRGTPAVFIEGRQLSQPTTARIRQAVADAAG